MEVFKVFATMSLVDLISGPLAKIQGGLGATGKAVSGLGDKMGRFAMAMVPVALAASVLIGSFGALAGEAMAFESVMADVAKVVDFDGKAEFDAMGDAILDLSGRIPMAADGIAAIVSAAAQSGIAKNDLLDFAEVAAKMGVAFDISGDQAGKTMADWRAGMNLSLPRVYALADAVNHLSNNMNATAPALSEVLQRVGSLAMQAGLAETQVAALGAAFLSAGAAPEVASTALKKFTSTLTLGESMSDRQAAAFKQLGFSVKQLASDMQSDAQGAIMRVMESLAAAPKEMQVALLNTMFGELGVGAIAPLLANMGNLKQAFDLVADSTQFAGSMQAEYDARSRTTENSIQLLRNKLTATAVTMGNAFLPSIKTGVDFLGDLTDGVRTLMATDAGQWLLQVVAALASAALGLTAFAAAIWAVRMGIPAIGGALAPLKAILLGISWPVWAVIGAFAALYLAYKSNFGGIADTINSWASKIKLVIDGVKAVFTSMNGGVGVITGELADKIRAAGLVEIVTNISKVLQRFRWFFKAVWMGVQESLHSAAAAMQPILDRLGALWQRFIGLFSGGELLGEGVTSSVGVWFSFGAAVGSVLGWLIDLGVVIVSSVVSGIEILVNAVSGIIALFNGDFAGAAAAGQAILQVLGDAFGRILDVLPFGLGDTLRGIFDTCVSAASDFGTRVSDTVSAGWNAVTNFFSGINLFESGAAILGTLVEGITSKGGAIVDAVSGAFAKVREYLPFSDAKTGPFSQLSQSGAAILTTLADGLKSGAGAFLGGIAGIFGSAKALLGFGDEEVQAPAVAAAQVPPNMPAALPEEMAAMPKMAGELVNEIGSTVTAGWAVVSDAFAQGWNAVQLYLDGLDFSTSGARIMDTLVEGINSRRDALVGAVSGAFAAARQYMPFSDARVGPFADLSYSGGAIMTTMARGVTANGAVLAGSVEGAFARAAATMRLPGVDMPVPSDPVESLRGTLSSLTDLVLESTGSQRFDIPAPAVPDTPGGFARGEGMGGQAGGSGGGQTLQFSVNELHLHEVESAKGLFAELQELASDYRGAEET